MFPCFNKHSTNTVSKKASQNAQNFKNLEASLSAQLKLILSSNKPRHKEKYRLSEGKIKTLTHCQSIKKRTSFYGTAVTVTHLFIWKKKKKAFNQATRSDPRSVNCSERKLTN